MMRSLRKLNPSTPAIGRSMRAEIFDMSMVAAGICFAVMLPSSTVGNIVGYVGLTSVPDPEAGAPLEPIYRPNSRAVFSSIAEGSVLVSTSMLKGPLPAIFTCTTIWLCTNSKGTSTGGFCCWALVADAPVAGNASANRAATPKRMAHWCINPAARGLDLNFKITSLHFRLPGDDIVHGSATRGRILLSIAAQTRASPQKKY